MSYRTIYNGAESTCWRKVAEDYREMITAGKLPPGTRLPATKEVAEKYRISVYSVQYAFASLTHEGLIIRRPGIGSVVCRFAPELKIVGILLLSYGRENAINSFRGMVITELAGKLYEKGCQVVTMIEDASLPDLAERIRASIRKLGIQAMIPFSCRREDMPIFQKINIPCVHDALFANSCRGVVTSREEFIETAVRSAAAHNRRKPALITTFTDRKADDSDSFERTKKQFFRTYRKTLKETGGEYHPEWIFRSNSGQVQSPEHHIERGYHAMLRLWDSPERPDSLILFTDDLLYGVAQAIAKRNIRVPEDLLILSHCNSFQKLYVPFPLIRIGFDTSEYADALIEQVFREFARKEPLKKIVHYQIKSEV